MVAYCRKDCEWDRPKVLDAIEAAKKENLINQAGNENPSTETFSTFSSQLSSDFCPMLCVSTFMEGDKAPCTLEMMINHSKQQMGNS